MARFFPTTLLSQSRPHDKTARFEDLDTKVFEEIDVKNLLTHYEHRIITLEAEFLDEQKNSRSSSRSIHDRSLRIQKVKTMLAHFQSDQFNYSEQSMHDIGLPRIYDFNTEDQKIFETFLTEQSETITSLRKQLDVMESWCKQASTGSTSILKTIVRLPKIGRIIKKLESSTKEIESQEKSLNISIEQTLDKLRMSSPLGKNFSPVTGNPKEPLFDRLAFWFGKIERQITKVAKLKVELKRQQYKIQTMENWLRVNDVKKTNIPKQEIPSLIDLTNKKQNNGLYKRLMRFSKLNRKIETYLTSQALPDKKGPKI